LIIFMVSQQKYASRVVEGCATHREEAMLQYINLTVGVRVRVCSMLPSKGKGLYGKEGS
jgi:hypothetical protein